MTAPAVLTCSVCKLGTNTTRDGRCIECIARCSCEEAMALRAALGEAQDSRTHWEMKANELMAKLAGVKADPFKSVCSGCETVTNSTSAGKCMLCVVEERDQLRELVAELIGQAGTTQERLDKAKALGVEVT